MIALDLRASNLLTALEANGGQLLPQPPRADGLASYLVDYVPGADRARCRAILAEARAVPGLLAAMLDVVAARRGAA